MQGACGQLGLLLCILLLLSDMKKFNLSFLALALCAMAVLCGCKGRQDKTAVTGSVDYSQVKVPAFNADSAYRFVADQVAFGYRTPGSAGQAKCADYIVRQMRRWCDTVIVQDFPATLWDGTQVKGKNIIASLEAKDGNPSAKRIVLAAHWDSRLWADQDPDEANRHHPIDGANDGASGVGVLMEMARVMQAQRPSVAIDFVFFDVEDQGCPAWADEDDYTEDSWCKGSQYWSRNPHVPYYSAVYGVLLDIVGTEQPRYTKEEVSRQYAANVMDKMWTAAAACGYQAVFENSKTSSILDDHYYVNTLAGIPMIDVVQNNSGCSFFPYWHTVNDNMQHVDKKSLATTGIVVMKTIYGDYE